jgi:hypothetical protein
MNSLQSYQSFQAANTSYYNTASNNYIEQPSIFKTPEVIGNLMSSNTHKPGQRRSFAKITEKKKNREQIMASKNTEFALK